MTDWIRSGQVRFFPELADHLVDIDSVHPTPWNYNNGDVELIAESMATNGMYDICRVQDSSDEIFIGNHTWLACKELGSHQVPVIRYDVDDETAQRLAIADNEIARRAKPDPGLMVDILDRLKKTQVGITGTGVSEKQLETLRALNKIPLKTEPTDAETDPVNWPTLSIQIPPSLHRAFMYLTRDASDGDLRDRLELCMRLAGWEK